MAVNDEHMQVAFARAKKKLSGKFRIERIKKGENVGA
jgi:ribosomal protein L16/L10AE